MDIIERIHEEEAEIAFFLREEFGDMNTQDLIGSECDIADELIVICEEQVVVDRHDESNNWTCSDPNCPCQGWEIDEQADLANAEYYYNQL